MGRLLARAEDADDLWDMTYAASLALITFGQAVRAPASELIPKRIDKLAAELADLAVNRLRKVAKKP